MAYLLDTMALSELTKKRANVGFRSWVSQMADAEAFVGVPSIGELQTGVRLLEPGEKRHRLEFWLSALIEDYGRRILPFDLASARAWGDANARARRRGITMPIVDAQLAAIAVTNDLTLVTRNTKHFREDVFERLRVLSPWT